MENELNFYLWEKCSLKEGRQICPVPRLGTEAAPPCHNAKIVRCIYLFNPKLTYICSLKGYDARPDTNSAKISFSLKFILTPNLPYISYSYKPYYITALNLFYYNLTISIGYSVFSLYIHLFYFIFYILFMLAYLFNKFIYINKIIFI